MLKITDGNRMIETERDVYIITDDGGFTHVYTNGLYTGNRLIGSFMVAETVGWNPATEPWYRREFDYGVELTKLLARYMREEGEA